MISSHSGRCDHLKRIASRELTTSHARGEMNMTGKRILSQRCWFDPPSFIRSFAREGLTRNSHRLTPSQEGPIAGIRPPRQRVVREVQKA